MKFSGLSVAVLALATASTAWAQNRDQDRYEPERRDTQIRGDRQSSDYNRRPDDDDTWVEWARDWWDEDDQDSNRSSASTSDRRQNSSAREGQDSRNQVSPERTTQYRGDSSQSGEGRTQRESQSMSSQSQGATKRGGVEQFFSRYDENDDNSISRNELPQGMRSNFAQIDRDGNDRLSASELRQHMSRQQKLQQPVVLTYVWLVDAGRNRIKLEDLQEAYSLLSEIDENGNGKISKDELQARRQQVASRMVDRCFNNHDDNDDDRLTREEAQGTALSSQFSEFDQNGDGRVSRSEVKKALEQQLQQQSDSSDESQQKSKSKGSNETASR